MEMRSKLVVGLFVLVSLVLGSPAHASDDEAEQMRTWLGSELRILHWLERDVERLDMARLRLIETNVRVTLDSLNQNGLAHARTTRSFQQMIITFRYSSAFFSQIETDETRVQIKELLTTNEDVIRKLGFDDSPFTQITANVFTQMHKLFLQLHDSGTLSGDLQTKVNDLIVPLGQVIAIARQGDRPRTFEAAIPVYRNIVKLYPAFNKIESSHAAFDIIIEIQGLNEFYGEFAQATEDRSPQTQPKGE